MTVEKTNKIILTELDWRRLAHARLLGMVWAYSRDVTVVDEDIPKPWVATGLYRLTRQSAWVVAKFNREATDHLISTDWALAALAYQDWRAVNGITD